MSLSASALKILLKHGVDPDAIVEIAEASEAEAAAAREARLEARRESNRRRQRAWYDRNVRNNQYNGVSVQDNKDNAPNGVMQREDVSTATAQRPPTPPKTTPEVITPSLPSEATAPLPSKSRRFEWPIDFEDRFWAAYPRHTDRKKAMVSLGRVRRADRVAFDDVIAGCQRLADAGIEPQFLPHPTTWLNNERWSDEIPSRVSGSPNGQGPPRGQSSSPQQRAFDRARQAHFELMEDRHDQDPSEADAEGHFGASGPQDRHPHQDVHEPPGGRLRLAPPRLGFPPRAH